MMVKYPKTPHLPWSPGRTADDRVLDNVDHFEGREIVITEKLDGENTTLYRAGYHARSLDTDYHPTRTWVQNFQAKIGWEIPEGWRICGENLAGRHAIKYRNLPSYFFAFSVWDENNVCLSWNDTVAYCEMLGIETAPVITRTRSGETFHSDPRLNRVLESIPDWVAPRFSDEMEGYVIRVADSFTYDEFSKSVAKFVRADHVDPSNTHWRHAAVETNDLL